MAQAIGHAVLPIESAQLEQLVSTGLTVAAALVSWWKNNSFTPEAIEADDYFYKLHRGPGQRKTSYNKNNPAEAGLQTYILRVNQRLLN